MFQLSRQYTFLRLLLVLMGIGLYTPHCLAQTFLDKKREEYLKLAYEGANKSQTSKEGILSRIIRHHIDAGNVERAEIEINSLTEITRFDLFRALGDKHMARFDRIAARKAYLKAVDDALADKLPHQFLPDDFQVIPVAKQLVKLGNTADALKLQYVLKSIYKKSELLLSIAKEQIKEMDYQGALATLKMALTLINENRKEYTSHLTEIAVLQFEAKDKFLARNSLTLACLDAEELKNKDERDWAYTLIAEAYAGINDVERGLQATRKISDKCASEWAIVEMIAKFADKLDVVKALDNLELIKQPENTSWACYYVGEAFVKLGEKDKALPYLQRAFDIGRRAFPESSFNNPIVEVTTKWMNLGELDKIEKHLQYFDENRRLDERSFLVKEYTKRGQLDKAWKQYKAILKQSTKHKSEDVIKTKLRTHDSALWYIGEHFVRIGDLKEAEIIVSRMIEFSWKRILLAKIAKRYDENGDAKATERILKAIEGSIYSENDIHDHAYEWISLLDSLLPTPPVNSFHEG